MEVIYIAISFHSQALLTLGEFLRNMKIIRYVPMNCTCVHYWSHQTMIEPKGNNVEVNSMYIFCIVH